MTLSRSGLVDLRCFESSNPDTRALVLRDYDNSVAYCAGTLLCVPTTPGSLHETPATSAGASTKRHSSRPPQHRSSELYDRPLRWQGRPSSATRTKRLHLAGPKTPRLRFHGTLVASCKTCRQDTHNRPPTIDPPSQKAREIRIRSVEEVRLFVLQPGRKYS